MSVWSRGSSDTKVILSRMFSKSDFSRWMKSTYFFSQGFRTGWIFIANFPFAPDFISNTGVLTIISLGCEDFALNT